LADILGPNGQPLQSSESSSKAQLDLASQLDALMEKNFNKHLKFINSITAGEEDYWKKATQYASSHAGILSKQHDQRIKDIRREQDAEMDKARRTEDGLKNIASIREKYRKQEEDALKKHEGQQATLSTTGRLHGGITRAVGTALPEVGVALAGIGTLVTESATGVGFFIAALELAAKAAVSLSERQAELGRSSAGLTAAGFGLGIKGSASEDARQDLFGGAYSGILGVAAGRKALGSLAASPALLNESLDPKNIQKFQNTLSAFGTIMPDANEEMEMFSKSSRSLGLDLEGLNNVFGVSRIAMSRLEVNQKDSAEMFLDLQKSFRGFTLDGNIAAGTLLGLSTGLKKFFPGVEEQKQALQTIGGAEGGQSFEKLSGMFAATHNGQLPPEEDPFAKGASLSDAPALINNYVKMIMAQAGTDKGPDANFRRNAMRSSLMKDIGMGGLGARMVPQLETLTGWAAMPESAKDKAKADKLASEATKVGRDKQIEATGWNTVAINKLTNAFTKYGLNNGGLGIAARGFAGGGVTGTIIDVAMHMDEIKNGARSKKK